jgi:hypothetical protein
LLFLSLLLLQFLAWLTPALVPLAALAPLATAFAGLVLLLPSTPLALLCRDTFTAFAGLVLLLPSTPLALRRRDALTALLAAFAGLFLLLAFAALAVSVGTGLPGGCRAHHD